MNAAEHDHVSTLYTRVCTMCLLNVKLLSTTCNFSHSRCTSTKLPESFTSTCDGWLEHIAPGPLFHNVCEWLPQEQAVEFISGFYYHYLIMALLLLVQSVWWNYQSPMTFWCMMELPNWLSRFNSMNLSLSLFYQHQPSNKITSLLKWPHLREVNICALLSAFNSILYCL